MRICLLIVAVSVLILGGVRASDIDSLKYQYQKATSDSTKAIIALQLCDKLGRNEGATAETFAQEALQYYTTINQGRS